MTPPQPGKRCDKSHTNRLNIVQGNHCPDREQGGALVTWFDDAPPLPGSDRSVCACAGAGSLASRPAGVRPGPWVSPGWGGERRPVCPGFWSVRREAWPRAGELQVLLSRRVPGPAAAARLRPRGLWCCGALGQGGARNWGAAGPGDRGGPWFPLSAPRGIAAARGTPWCWRFRLVPLGPRGVGKWKPGECWF